MENCFCYELEKVHYKSSELNCGRNPAEITTAQFYWCSHKHSLVTKERAMTTVGASQSLMTCGGDMNKCPIPEEHRFDF